MTNRSRILAVLIAVLLTGGLLGIAGHQFFNKVFKEPSGNIAALKVKKGYQERFSKRLQLTEEQEAQLNEILKDSRHQINDVEVELESRVEAIRSATNQRITAILSDEQKKKFQQLLSETKSHKHFDNDAESSSDKGEKH